MADFLQITKLRRPFSVKTCKTVRTFLQVLLTFYNVTKLRSGLIRSHFSRKIVKLLRNRYEVLQGFTNLH